MAVIKGNEIRLEEMTIEGVRDMSGTNVIGPEQGWQSHTLRVFRLRPGGFSPRHSHDWEHVNYVIKGSGKLRLGNNINDLKKGSFAFVPPNVEHQFENPSDEDFEFICIVPNRDA